MNNVKEIYSGPERSYPKKTFPSGEEKPNVVLEELLQLPDYIDYSVFSRNQLRFAEVVFKSDTYQKNENYIRSKNFFINLSKPKYWNKVNYGVLFTNINIVINIVKDIFTELKNIEIAEATPTDLQSELTVICDNLLEVFSIGNGGTMTIESLKKIATPNEVLKAFFKSDSKTIKNTQIFGMGIFLATYAKVVSILTYVNPYVLIRKDSGVDSIKAPVSTIKGLDLPAGFKTTKANKFTDLSEEDFATDAIEYEPKDRELDVYKNKDDTTEITRVKKNPLIHLLHFPLYSLNILLPITIAPRIFIAYNTSKTSLLNSGNMIIISQVKALMGYLKINFNTVISRLHFHDNGKRLNVNLIFKKQDGKKEKAQLKITKGKNVNLTYFERLKGLVIQHAFFTGSIGINTSTLTEMTGNTSGIDQEIITEANKYLIKDKSNFNPEIPPNLWETNKPISNPYTSDNYESLQRTNEILTRKVKELEFNDPKRKNPIVISTPEASKRPAGVAIYD